MDDTTPQALSNNGYPLGCFVHSVTGLFFNTYSNTYSPVTTTTSLCRKSACVHLSGAFLPTRVRAR